MRWRFFDKALFFAPWESILALKAGSLEEYGLLDRWGEAGLVPSSLLLASCIQTAQWLVEASSGFTLSCEPTDIAHWRMPAGLRPGERFCVFLRVALRDNERIRFAARQKILLPEEPLPKPEIWQNTGEGESEHDGVLNCGFVPLQTRYSSADRACLWREVS